MTMTYGERRQRAYFTAAVELIRTATDLLNDFQLPHEFTEANDRWVKSLNTSTMNQARELESKGHEQCIASDAQERRLMRAKDKYSAAVDGYLKRRLAAVHGIRLPDDTPAKLGV
jgi:hypothetical protein